MRAAGRVALAPAALLVDEYQDTNPLQARLLAALRRMGSPQFSVGDPKQSIYRFRRADVRVIGAEARRVDESARHVLQATFRARPELVDCLNGLHAPLFAAGAAGVEHVPLRAEGAFREVAGPDVELVVLDAGADVGADARREAEAHWIATWIRDLVGRRVPRAKIEIDEQGDERPPRPLGYGDIAILLRARTSLTLYEDALAALGIPFHTHKGRGFFQTEEIVDLVHTLRVVHDPADDHAFACFATGPILGATDADLLRLFPAGGDGATEPGTAWSRLAGGAAASGAPRRAEVVRIVERLRREALAGRLGRVVEGVLYDLGLLEVALLQPDGARRGANLRKAVAVAREMERSGREGLDDLLRRLETLRDREIAESEAALGREGEDVVRINTVHGAKGLEYPVVVLADIGRRAGGGRDAIVYDGEGAFAAKLRHPLEGVGANPAGLTTLLEEERAREEEESLRLLYVGTTRAEERLLLVGSCGGRKKDGRLKDLFGWAPWLIDACGHEPAADPVELAYDRGRVRVRLVERAPGAAATDGAVGARRAVDRGVRRGRCAARRGPRARRAARRHALRRHRQRPAGVRRVAGPPPCPAPGAARPARPQGPRGARRSGLGRPHRRGVRSATRGARPTLGRGARRRGRHRPRGAGPCAARAARDPRTRRHRRPRPTRSGRCSRLSSAYALRTPPRGCCRRWSRATPPPRRRRPSNARWRPATTCGARSPSTPASASPPGPRWGASTRSWCAARSTCGCRTWRGEFTSWTTRRIRPGRGCPRPRPWRSTIGGNCGCTPSPTERLRGADVAGAHLLLLDPDWGPEAVEVTVDVSGPALEEARRLCRAYAVAALEGRWPASWGELLAPSL